VCFGPHAAVMKLAIAADTMIQRAACTAIVPHTPVRVIGTYALSDQVSGGRRADA
jgi:hypothetical protein